MQLNKNLLHLQPSIGQNRSRDVYFSKIWVRKSVFSYRQPHRRNFLIRYYCSINIHLFILYQATFMHFSFVRYRTSNHTYIFQITSFYERLFTVSVKRRSQVAGHRSQVAGQRSQVTGQQSADQKKK